jgi:hypothetical protein
MKYLLILVIILSLVGCREYSNTIVYAPYISPKTCFKCGESRTYRIVSIDRGRLLDHNRRCAKCGYTWFCERCEN